MATLKTQELVEMFCQQKDIVNNLVYISSMDTFCYYQEEGYFKVLKPIDLERRIYMFLYANIQKNLSVAQVKDFVGQLKYRVYHQEENMSTPYVALAKNKTLNTDDFSIIDSSTKTPAYYFINCDPDIISSYNSNPPELWQQFLDEVVVRKDLTPDKELQQVVQEMMGYYLLDTLAAHATFFLVGCGQNGKSVMLNVLRKMIGEEFSTALSIEQLTTSEFAASTLVGKKINICLEEESSYIKSDKFKAMVSGDPISVRRLYQEHFTWEPTVKHIFATNEMPTFSGLNFGLVRRIKIIPFHRKISEDKKDTQLTAKLLKELSGIMAWSIEGAKRLRANRFRFSNSIQIEEKSAEFQENISATILFMNEKYVPDTYGEFISDDELYEEYKIWADSRGKKKQSYYVFIRDLNTIDGITQESGRYDDKECLGRRLRKVDEAKQTQPELIPM